MPLLTASSSTSQFLDEKDLMPYPDGCQGCEWNFGKNWLMCACKTKKGVLALPSAVEFSKFYYPNHFLPSILVSMLLTFAARVLALQPRRHHRRDGSRVPLQGGQLLEGVCSVDIHFSIGVRLSFESMNMVMQDG